jgi:hypothetical protein
VSYATSSESPFTKRLRHAVGEALSAPLNIGSARRGRRALENTTPHMGKLPNEFKQSWDAAHPIVFAPTGGARLGLSLPSSELRRDPSDDLVRQFQDRQRCQ